MKLESEEIREVFRKLSTFDTEVRSEAVENLLALYIDNREYTLDRLLKGLSSSNEFARVGFGSALSELLSRYPEQEIIGLVKGHFTSKTASIVGKVNARCVFVALIPGISYRCIFRAARCGFLTALHSIILSGMDLDDKEMEYIVTNLIQNVLNAPIFALFATMAIQDLTLREEAAVIFVAKMERKLGKDISKWSSHFFYLAFQIKLRHPAIMKDDIYGRISNTEPDLELFISKLTSCPLDTFSLSPKRPIWVDLHPLWKACFDSLSDSIWLKLWEQLDKILVTQPPKGHLQMVGVFEHLLTKFKGTSNLSTFLRYSKNSVVYIGTFKRGAGVGKKSKTDPKIRYSQQVLAGRVIKCENSLIEVVGEESRSESVGMNINTIAKYHILSASVHKPMLRMFKRFVLATNLEVLEGTEIWASVIKNLFLCLEDPVKGLLVDLSTEDSEHDTLIKIKLRIIEVMSVLYPLISEEDVQAEVIRRMADIVLLNDQDGQDEEQDSIPDEIQATIRDHLFSLLSHSKHLHQLENFCLYISESAERINLENDEVLEVLKEFRVYQKAMKMQVRSDGLYWLLMSLLINSVFTNNTLCNDTLLVCSVGQILDQDLTRISSYSCRSFQRSLEYFHFPGVLRILTTRGALANPLQAMSNVITILFSCLSIPSALVRGGANRAFSSLLPSIPERMLMNLVEMLTESTDGHDHHDDEEMDGIDEEGDADESSEESEDGEDPESEESSDESEEEEEEEEDLKTEVLPKHKLMSLQLYAMGSTNEELMKIDALRETMARESKEASSLDVKYKILELVERIITHKLTVSFIFQLPRILVLAASANVREQAMVSKIDALLRKLYKKSERFRSLPKNTIPILFKSLDELFELMEAAPPSDKMRIGTCIAFLLKALNMNNALEDPEIVDSIIKHFDPWIADFAKRKPAVGSKFFIGLIPASPVIFSGVARAMLQNSVEARPYLQFQILTLVTEGIVEIEVQRGKQFPDIASAIVKMAISILKRGSSELCKKAMAMLALFKRRLKDEDSISAFQNAVADLNLIEALNHTIEKYREKLGVVSSLESQITRFSGEDYEKKGRKRKR